jgi:hypothetical protein
LAAEEGTAKGGGVHEWSYSNIVRQYCLRKMQVGCQLLNYKTGNFMNKQVSILLNLSHIDERLREGMAMSTPEFASSTQVKI